MKQEKILLQSCTILVALLHNEPKDGDERMISEERNVIVAPFPRTMNEIFSEGDLKRLTSFAKVLWAEDQELPESVLENLLPETWAFVGFSPPMTTERMQLSSQLKVILEVGGHFPTTIDYSECFARGIRVLSCAPAFARQVAEMALSMSLASVRGLVAAHVAFTKGEEEWQGDRPSDFSLFGQDVGFVGFGSIARELLRLLNPFGCRIRVTDPWIHESIIRGAGCEPATLKQVMSTCRVIYVLATPAPENLGLISREQIERMQPGALLVLISRAHLVDFAAVVDAAAKGKIQAAIDVFPTEPMPPDATVRSVKNTILSPHRAASIRRERQAIGRMVVDDLEVMAKGLPPSLMQIAQPEIINRRIGLAASRRPPKTRNDA
jgi:phosphoglycerate dehydrogenase-like enzyme